MRRASRLCLVLGLSAAALFTAPTPAHACSCMAATEAEYLSRADAVFQGTITRRSDPNGGAPMQSSADPVTWTVDVDKIEKGQVADPQDVQSSRDSASCGYDFVVGKRYRVFANRQENGKLATGLCSGTAEQSAPPPTSTVVATTTTSRAPRPTTTSTAIASTTTTTSAPTTTSTTTAFAIRPASDNDNDNGGGRGGLAVIAALGVLATGAGALLIRRFR